MSKIYNFAYFYYKFKGIRSKQIDYIKINSTVYNQHGMISFKKCGYQLYRVVCILVYNYHQPELTNVQDSLYPRRRTRYILAPLAKRSTWRKIQMQCMGLPGAVMRRQLSVVASRIFPSSATSRLKDASKAPRRTDRPDTTDSVQHHVATTQSSRTIPGII